MFFAGDGDVSTMDVTTREADGSDVPSLEIVRRQAIEDGYSGAFDRSSFADLVAGDDAELPHWIDSPAHDVAVVESEVTILAYGVFDRERAVLRGLYTAPAYQREGWASRLLDRFEASARSAGRDAIEVTVPVTALRFFQARGFEAQESVERKGVEARMMRKDLPGNAE